MKFKTINPATEEVIKEYSTQPKEEVLNSTKKAENAFETWGNFSVEERAPYFKNLAVILRQNREKYARLITTEMGKPIKQSIAEVEKCAWTSDFYSENASKWLKDEEVKADGKKHIIAYEPLGVILAVMPWNYPFWQAFRFAIPTLLAGNTAILNHSNVVPECALAIEEAFTEAGFPEYVFKTVIADHESVSELAKSDIIQGISLTGSTQAGQRIAEIAGKNLKKVVLELGGSDAFIVLDDADSEFAAKGAVFGRTNNAGQSCIAAKRFIMTEKKAKEFSKVFAEMTSKLIVGNPVDDKTDVGPLVNKEVVLQIDEFVKDAVSKGAKVLCGGKRKEGKGFFYLPTVLSNTNHDMKCVKEEVFGPVAPIIIVKDEKEAIKTANSLEFGLGASVWTKDEKKGLQIARKLKAGSVFVNSFVKSDARMPFGGIKKSGIGRELSKFGLREFTNVKGINIYEEKK